MRHSRLPADCGGRLRLLATIHQREVIEKILEHLGLPLDPPRPAPVLQTPDCPGVSSLTPPFCPRYRPFMCSVAPQFRAWPHV